MYRVTRKQKIVQGGNVIEFEDFMVCASEGDALIVQRGFLFGEVAVGYQWYGPDKVIFETPSFYRSVTVTIEEIK